MNYTILHLHSMFSNGTTNVDSVTQYTDYINTAKSFGMKALCFTEHGNVFGWLHKKEKIEAAGMKYIHGIEAYVTEDIDIDNLQRDNYHVVLIAKNYDGVLEINRLSSKSYNKQDGHRYYEPRITLDELIATSDNVMITTACLGGVLHSGTPSAKEKFLNFLITNKHRCFLEIQHHNCQEQIDYNNILYSLSEETGLRLVVGTDTHALNQDHIKGRSLLQHAKGIHFSNEDEWDLTMKSYDDLITAYTTQGAPMDKVMQAIENTNIVADMVEEFQVDRSYKYPHLWDNPLQLFNEKIAAGIKRRGVDKYPNAQEYYDRIKYETQAYIHNEAIDFMLLMADILDWCRDNEIYVGYGRGSVNGSVIAWLLGITEEDSIKYNLNFERFMNTERVSLSDIDTDFPPSRIEDVKEYIYHKHGLYCSDIITFNTIAVRGAIDDVCRGLYRKDAEKKGIKIDRERIEQDYYAANNNKSYLHLADEIKQVFEQDEERARKQYPDVFWYVDLLVGCIVSVGSHPCGTIVAADTLDDKLGVFYTSTSNYPISQINMKEVDSLNYVKLDLLKLDTIELINETCKLAGIERLTPDNADFDDEKVWNAIRDDTTQIFQWEGSTGDEYIKQLLSEKNLLKFNQGDYQVDKMTLLTIGNSAIRPAGASYRSDLANGVIRKTGSKPIDEFLKPTFGYLVFQCQIIQFLNQYCGFTMGEADIVRRGFAKKTGTEQYIPIIKNGGYLNGSDHYIAGYIDTMKERYSISEERSEKDIMAFLQVIEDASSYLFSLNHSQPYSHEGYVSGWLRTYYPLEFLTIAMNINIGKQEKTAALIRYMKKIGIQMKPITFRYSRDGYFCDKNTNVIYKGIGSIKHLNAKVAQELYTLRDNQYVNFAHLLDDISAKTSADSRQIEILIRLDFFSEFGEINKLLDIYNMYKLIGNRKTIKIAEVGEKYPIPMKVFETYAEKVTEKQMKFDPNGIRRVLNYYIKHHSVDRCLVSDIIKAQQEYLGYIDYVNPEADKREIVVMDLNVKYSPRFVAYNIKTGQSCPMKVYKNYNRRARANFKTVPFKEGDVLYMKECKREHKKVWDGKRWIPSKDEMEWWLLDYEVIA